SSHAWPGGFPGQGIPAGTWSRACGAIITSSRRPIRTGGSGECRKWRKIKTAASHEADRERWRLFERASLEAMVDRPDNLAPPRRRKLCAGPLASFSREDPEPKFISLTWRFESGPTNRTKHSHSLSPRKH